MLYLSMKKAQITLQFLFLLLVPFIFSCSSNTVNSEDKTERQENLTTISESNLGINIDLDDILERDTLRAITIYSPTSYFIYKGEVMGFEYELLSRLSEVLGVHLKIIVAKDLDDMEAMLNSGEGDIIAYGMTITERRKEKVSFTKPYMKIHQVLVQKSKNQAPNTYIDDITQLKNKTVSVRKNSAYAERLVHISKEIGSKIIIDTIDGRFTTPEIIDMVHDGKISYTISDDNIANVSASYYYDLDMKTPVSLSQNLAWMVRKTSPQLLKKMNQLIHKSVGGLNYNLLYNKYFRNKRKYVKRRGKEFYCKERKEISQYDALIKKYAVKINWDWRLLASQIYQESRFNNHGRSWVGAGGLMQIMPRTARSLGVHNVHHPEQNVKGGTKYLKQLWGKWEQIPDSVQRLKLTLASYNCGLYHVFDAQYLAKKNGKNYQSWDNGIDEYILKLSKPNYFNLKGVKYGYVRGREPYNYVKEIFERYDNYIDFLD